MSPQLTDFVAEVGSEGEMGRQTIHTLRQPASEKRQGTKSRVLPANLWPVGLSLTLLELLLCIAAVEITLICDRRLQFLRAIPTMSWQLVRN